MSELRPVRSNASLIDRHLTGLAKLLVVAIAVLIAKPWDWLPGSGPIHPQASVRPAASEVGAPSGSPRPDVGFEDLVYDSSIFGIHEKRGSS